MGISTALAGLGDVLGLGGIGDVFGSIGSALGLGGAAAAGDAGAALGAGELGALGTASAFVDPAAAAGLSVAGPTVAGTAADFLAAPAASALGAGALTTGIGGAAADAALSEAATSGLASGLGSLAPSSPSLAGLGVSPAAGVSSTGIGGAGVSSPSSVFNTGTTPLTGVSSTGAPSAVTAAPSLAPAAPGAASAPAGAGATDLTSAATPAATGAGTGGNVLDTLAKNALGQVTKNPLSLVGPAASLGALGYTLTQSNKQLPEQTALQTAATTATNQGNQLSSYLLSGTLPPGMQTALDKATADAKTAAISNAAKNGQPTDPSQNTALAQELASIDQQAVITQANVGQQLLQSGLSETQLASSDYATLLSADQSQQSNITNAISNFAKSLGGLGTSGLRLNIGTSS